MSIRRVPARWSHLDPHGSGPLDSPRAVRVRRLTRAIHPVPGRLAPSIGAARCVDGSRARPTSPGAHSFGDPHLVNNCSRYWRMRALDHRLPGKCDNPLPAAFPHIDIPARRSGKFRTRDDSRSARFPHRLLHNTTRTTARSTCPTSRIRMRLRQLIDRRTKTTLRERVPARTPLPKPRNLPARSKPDAPNPQGAAVKLRVTHGRVMLTIVFRGADKSDRAG